ncbi:response regulator transcription factor [Enterobacter ludwigii]
MNPFSGKKIYVALLDDHPIVRKGMEIIFSQEPDFELKGSFATRIELMNFLRNNRVDVLVLDYLLGDEEIDGLPMIKQLMSNFPWLKILLSSTLENTAIVRMALKIGVRGHVGKSRDLSEVVNAARQGVSPSQKAWRKSSTSFQSLVQTRNRVQRVTTRRR